MPDTILTWGIELVLWMQTWGDWLAGPMNFFTFTGTAEFYLLILPVVYWCLDTRFGLRLALVLLLSLIINAILKLVFHDPRPYWFDARVELWATPEKTFGIPSGHAQNSVVLWGMFAAYFNKGWGWVVAVAIIFFTGLSRIYLGVHFPTDVLLGWLLGAVILVLFLKVEGPVSAWVGRRSPTEQIGLAFGVSLGLIFIAAVISSGVMAASQLPPLWVENALADAPEAIIRPLSLEDIIVTNAVLFGMVSGAVILSGINYSFDAGGVWYKRLARYAVGLVGIVVVWLGLRLVFQALVVTDSMADYVFSYMRYTLVGLWITFFAPLIFIKLGLAQSKKDALQQM